MDEDAYRSALASSISQPCPFEKSILTRCAVCAQAEKHNLAEREAVACKKSSSREQCIALHDTLREKFAFALHRKVNAGPLPHAQVMRVQCGGLKGLRYVLEGEGEVENVAALVLQARQTYGEFSDFPYEAIVHWVAENYRYRR